MTKTTRQIDSSSFHDFKEENLTLMVLGAYNFLNKSKFVTILNALYIILISCLIGYLIAMAVTTFFMISGEKIIVVQIFQNLCLLSSTVCEPLIRYLTRDYLDRAHELIRDDMYDSSDEEFRIVRLAIRKRRVDQIRILMKWLGILLATNALANTVFVPLMQFLFLKEELDADTILNPYLPLPIYMPFRTDTVIGYAAGFTSNGVCWFFVCAVVFSMEATYLSCTLQLVAQIEILNYSLKNIRRRAMASVRRKLGLDLQHLDELKLFDCKEFQNALYCCLRENVIHHQAIIRLTKNIRPFIEGINGFAMFVFSLILASSCVIFLENPSLNFAVLVTLLSDILCYFQLCFVGQIITDKSSDIKEALFSTPWYNCNGQYKVLLRIMLTNSQPLVLRSTAFKASVSLETFGEMITTAYKILNVLGR